MREEPTLEALAGADASAENSILRAALADAQRRIVELEERTESDVLTGLADGRRYARALERVAGVSTRHGTTAAVVCVELQDLETIEAAHGPMAAEAAVVHVARSLSGLIRTTDLLARTGAAEFGLIAAAPLDLGHTKVTLKAVAAATSLLPGDTAPEVLTRAARNLSLARAEA
jgi:GGDEF domain-containing protein